MPSANLRLLVRPSSVLVAPAAANAEPVRSGSEQTSRKHAEHVPTRHNTASKERLFHSLTHSDSLELLLEASRVSQWSELWLSSGPAQPASQSTSGNVRPTSSLCRAQNTRTRKRGATTHKQVRVRVRDFTMLVVLRTYHLPLANSAGAPSAAPNPAPVRQAKVDGWWAASASSRSALNSYPQPQAGEDLLYFFRIMRDTYDIRRVYILECIQRRMLRGQVPVRHNGEEDGEDDDRRVRIAEGGGRHKWPRKYLLSSARQELPRKRKSLWWRGARVHTSSLTPPELSPSLVAARRICCRTKRACPYAVVAEHNGVH